MAVDDLRLEGLNSGQHQEAVEFLTLNNAWDTSFLITPSASEKHGDGLKIRWENEKAFAEFSWLLINGRSYREFKVRSERGSWSESRLPSRSQRNTRFAKFLRRFSR